MYLLALIISSLSAIFLIIAAIAFLRAKDVFTMTHVTMAANCYLLPLILIAVELERFSLISAAKIATIIILNLIVTNLLCQTIVRRAMVNKVTPDAKEVE